MGLLEYKKKRTLSKTPEPGGGRGEKDVLRFVVQKHDASHLHYDFRLEIGNVLKSWAIPKGPSMDPKVKRLAVEVEDHPYDYRTFEGVIPEGNYGAGTVMLWDEGTYHNTGNEFKDKKSEDKDLLKQWKDGKIKFRLEGEKLKGEFALVKSRRSKQWLLMKLKDEYASSNDILDKDTSVASDRTLDQIMSGKSATKRPVASAKKKTRVLKGKSKNIEPSESTHTEIIDVRKVLKIARTGKFFTSLSPMLATLVDQPFDRPGWVYEIKWDGYRAVAFMKDDIVHLKSRNDKSFDEKFYPVVQALKDWNVDAIVDGEVVVIKPNGISDFGSLQNWRSEADGDLLYYVFDILWLDGKDLRDKTLLERRAILRSILRDDQGVVRLSDIFNVAGTEFYATATRMGLEGIIAKKADSTYQAGARTNEWLKIKANQRQEVVIGGYTHNLNSVKAFSALLVGVYEGDKFVYTGKVGTGFGELQQRELLRQFEPYITDKAPFSELPDYNKPSRFNPRPAKASVTWLKPKLVCEVSFTEMTSDGVMRHPSFEGMREDKEPKKVTHEIPKHAPVSISAAKKSLPKESSGGHQKPKTSKPIIKPHSKRERATLLNPKEETQVRSVEGNELKFTNLSKVYWPVSKKGAKGPVTKRDMLNYYYQIAPYILPYLKDRPQSLNRFPNGITGKSFYQKDVTGKVPDWVDTYLYHNSEEPDVDRNFLVPQSDADVLLMASLGAIEMNPWSSTIKKPGHPDWCIIDLDPGKNPFGEVIEAALVTKSVFDELKIDSYCKTSGSTGLHIYVPLGAKFTYQESQDFARAIVTIVNQRIPKFTSIERMVSKRKGKMYLDFLQNRPQATLASPYSLRPKPGAPVSMPLHWDEVKKGMELTDFNITNAVARVREVGDIFKPVLGKGVDLKKFRDLKNT